MEGGSLEVCKLCNEPMNDPRILPCAHSFCLKCLESSAVLKDSSKCPTCQMEFAMPKGGLIDLKKNEFVDRLNNLKQINNSCVSCDSCKENQAIKFCIDCPFNYCSTCLEHHGRIPTTNSHRLLDHKITTKLTTDKTNMKKYSTCDEHYELETLFCLNESCRIALCSHCFINNHKNHTIMHLSDYFDSTKVKFEDHLKMKEEILWNINKNFRSSENTMCENELKATNLKKEILQRGEDVKKAVDSIVDELIQKVDEDLKQHKKEADDIMMKLINMEANLNAYIETLKKKLNNLSLVNVVERSFTTLENMEKIENIQKYCGNVNILFRSYENLSILKDIFGNITRGLF